MTYLDFTLESLKLGVHMKKVFTAVAIAAMISGCANTRFNGHGEVTPSSVPKYEDRQTYFVGGIGQKQTIDAAKICAGADKIQATATEITFVDGLLGLLTFGIYTPQTARVYCK